MELPHKSHLLNLLLTDEGRQLVKRCFAKANIIPPAAGGDDLSDDVSTVTIESIAEDVQKSLQALNDNIVAILDTLTTASTKYTLLATTIRAQHPHIHLDTTGFYPPGQPYDATGVEPVSAQPGPPYETVWDPYAYTHHQ